MLSETILKSNFMMLFPSSLFIMNKEYPIQILIYKNVLFIDTYIICFIANQKL